MDEMPPVGVEQDIACERQVVHVGLPSMLAAR